MQPKAAVEALAAALGVGAVLLVVQRLVQRYRDRFDGLDSVVSFSSRLIAGRGSAGAGGLRKDVRQQLLLRCACAEHAAASHRVATLATPGPSSPPCCSLTGSGDRGGGACTGAGPVGQGAGGSQSVQDVVGPH